MWILDVPSKEEKSFCAKSIMKSQICPQMAKNQTKSDEFISEKNFLNPIE